MPHRLAAAGGFGLLVVGVVTTVLLAQDAREGARDDVVAQLQAEAARRLIRWEAANEDAVSGLSRFANAFIGRDRVQPFPADIFRDMALDLAFTKDRREVVSSVSVWVYVSNDERAQWEAGASGPIKAAGLTGPPVPPSRVMDPDEQDFYLVIRQGYPNPNGPATGADYSRRLPDRWAAIQQCIEEKRPTATAPQLLARASGPVVGIPFQVPIRSMNETVRPIFGILGMRILSELLTAAALENRSDLDAATFSAVEDVSDPSVGPLTIGANSPLDNSTVIPLVEVVSDVAARKWRASVSTTEDAVAARRDTTRERTTWAVGLAVSVLVALAFVLGAEVWRRRREQELARFSGELAAATHDRLMTTVSHELRNPLTGVWAGVEFFLQSYGEGMSPDMRKDLEVVISCARAMQGVRDDMLDARRLEHGNVTFTRRAVHLDVLARDIGNVMRTYLPPDVSLAITVDGADAADASAVVDVDSLRCRQIIGTAVANACHYAAPATVVELRLSVCEGFLVAQVVDVGEPLPRGASELSLFGKPVGSDRHLPAEVLALVTAVPPANSCTEEHAAGLADTVLIRDLSESASDDGADSSLSPVSRLGVRTQKNKPVAVGSTLGLALSFRVAQGMGGSIGLRAMSLPAAASRSGPAGSSRTAVRFWLAVPANGAPESTGSAASHTLATESVAEDDGAPSLRAGDPSVAKRTSDDRVEPSEVAVSVGDKHEVGAATGALEGKMPPDGHAEAVPGVAAATAVDKQAGDVVVVDDEAIIRRIAGRIITKLGGRIAASLEDGCTLAATLDSLDHPPACVLLDIVMLRSNGIEVLRGLRSRADSKWATLPVYAMTSNVEYSSVEKYKQAGFSGVVGKPFNAAMLNAALDDAHRPPEDRAGSFLELLAPAAR